MSREDLTSPQKKQINKETNKPIVSRGFSFGQFISNHKAHITGEKDTNSPSQNSRDKHEVKDASERSYERS